MICSQCGKAINKRYGGMCQACYTYFRDGGIVHEPPAPGTIAYDSSGKVICHICGRSYTRLGSHIRESHDMTIAEYKERFGLCSNTKTTEICYSAKMHDLALKYKMDEQLEKAGKQTRFKKGDGIARKGKDVRLQERLEKRERNLPRWFVQVYDGRRFNLYKSFEHLEDARLVKTLCQQQGKTARILDRYTDEYYD